MTVFEVNISVQRDVAEQYLQWLEKHIHEVLAIDGFLSARVFEVEPAEGALPDFLLLCAQYMLKDRVSLDVYLRDHAARLRADGIARFGGKFTVQRRVMELKQEY